MFTIFSKEKNQEKGGRFFLVETKDKAEDLKYNLEVPPKKLNPKDLKRLNRMREEWGEIVDWRSGDLELEKEMEVVTPTPLLIEPSKNNKTTRYYMCYHSTCNVYIIPICGFAFLLCTA